MKNKYFLKTDRIGFRCWTVEDFEFAYNLWGDSDVTQFIATKKITIEDVEQRLKNEILSMNEYQIQYWPIFLLKTDNHLGCCGLRLYEGNENIYEIGFHLNKKFWGMGYAKEAANAIIEYAFSKLKVSALAAGHHPLNKSSEKLLLSLGFELSHKELYKPTGLMHPMYFLKIGPENKTLI